LNFFVCHGWFCVKCQDFMALTPPGGFRSGEVLKLGCRRW
jgi:hypothetical protein